MNLQEVAHYAMCTLTKPKLNVPQKLRYYLASDVMTWPHMCKSLQGLNDEARTSGRGWIESRHLAKEVE